MIKYSDLSLKRRGTKVFPRRSNYRGVSKNGNKWQVRLFIKCLGAHIN